MTDALDLPVLVLNRHFEPVQVTSAKRAFVMLYGGAAVALENGDAYDFPAWRALPVREPDEGVPVIGGELRVPRVLHLQRYDRRPRTAVRLSRKNLMLRDGYQCQYCARCGSLRELNIDHVLPRSRGGAASEQVVPVERQGPPPPAPPVPTLTGGWQVEDPASHFRPAQQASWPGWQNAPCGEQAGQRPVFGSHRPLQHCWVKSQGVLSAVHAPQTSLKGQGPLQQLFASAPVQATPSLMQVGPAPPMPPTPALAPQ
jgi:hypothetical protein